MRQRRVSDEQIVAMRPDAERTGQSGEVIRRYGISRESFYRWRRQDGGLQGSDTTRRRALEEETRQRKRVVADQALNRQVLKAGLGTEW